MAYCTANLTGRLMQLPHAREPGSDHSTSYVHAFVCSQQRAATAAELTHHRPMPRLPWCLGRVGDESDDSGDRGSGWPPLQAAAPTLVGAWSKCGSAERAPNGQDKTGSLEKDGVRTLAL